jgi:hypothetical protein
MDADKLISDAAETHRIESEHSVYVRPGYGWACEVCDSDILEDFIDCHAQSFHALASIYRARAEQRPYEEVGDMRGGIYTYAPVLLTGHVGRFSTTERAANVSYREARPWFGNAMFTQSTHPLAAIWRGEMSHRWRRNPNHGK